MLRRIALLACVLFSLVGTDLYAAATQIVGAPSTTVAVATGITTDTTSATKKFIPSGYKTFYGEVICTAGACAQTQAIYGAMTSTAENGILLCTITLTDTTRDQDACPVITATFPYYYVVTTSTSGTAATGAVYVAY